MDCEQARQLFDAYLDGELSPALATELGAHRIHCAECRQALALLEVSEHLIASDSERRELGRDFTNRLLACMDLPDESWRAEAAVASARNRASEPMVSRLRRGLFWAGVSAAAAAVALAFLGAFDRRGESHVAGLKVFDSAATVRMESHVPAEELHKALDPATGSPPSVAEDRSLQEWVGRVRSGIESKRRSVQSLREAFERLDAAGTEPERVDSSLVAPTRSPSEVAPSDAAETEDTMEGASDDLDPGTDADADSFGGEHPPSGEDDPSAEDIDSSSPGDSASEGEEDGHPDPPPAP